MRVGVDEGRCEGHARCIATAPDVFDVDDLGKSYVVLDDVPEELQDAARRAMEGCPERAIRELGG